MDVLYEKSANRLTFDDIGKRIRFKVNDVVDYVFVGHLTGIKNADSLYEMYILSVGWNITVRVCKTQRIEFVI